MSPRSTGLARPQRRLANYGPRRQEENRRRSVVNGTHLLRRRKSDHMAGGHAPKAQSAMQRDESTAHTTYVSLLWTAGRTQSVDAKTDNAYKHPTMKRPLL